MGIRERRCKVNEDLREELHFCDVNDKAHSYKQVEGPLAGHEVARMLKCLLGAQILDSGTAYGIDIYRYKS
jgi:hypothetical protein